MPNAARSITPFSSSPATPENGQQSLGPGPTGVVRRGQSRASNDALAWLATADVTPTGYRVGRFLANHSRYATAADVRRRVTPGEVFTFWPQSKIATELGCSERQVRRGIRSLREAGELEVRRRVRPCEASYVWARSVRSGVLSGVLSHTEPRTEPRTEEKNVRTVGKPTNFPSKRAEKGPPTSQRWEAGQTKQQRLVAAVCWKLGFSVTFAGLEEFAGREHTDKQALIKRLLRVEARHDRRSTRTRSGTGSTGDRSVTGDKRRHRSVTPFRKGRLQAEYAARWRSAHDE